VVFAGGKTTLPIVDDNTPLADLFKGVFERDNKKHNTSKATKLQLVGKVSQPKAMEEEEEEEEPVAVTSSGGKNKKRRRAK
jgi:hypothetical protein